MQQFVQGWFVGLISFHHQLTKNTLRQRWFYLWYCGENGWSGMRQESRDDQLPKTGAAAEIVAAQIDDAEMDLMLLTFLNLLTVCLQCWAKELQ